MKEISSSICEDMQQDNTAFIRPTGMQLKKLLFIMYDVFQLLYFTIWLLH